MTDAKLRHAASQEKYQQAKERTHKRVQVWVRRDNLKAWEAAVKRFQKKYD
jgi:hypothetical protein|tara:strand:- start:304 stop:456 length:153 start_codon:yes stop_codon:yes gene_type:complete